MKTISIKKKILAISLAIMVMMAYTVSTTAVAFADDGDAAPTTDATGSGGAAAVTTAADITETPDSVVLTIDEICKTLATLEPQKDTTEDDGKPTDEAKLFKYLDKKDAHLDSTGVNYAPIFNSLMGSPYTGSYAILKSNIYEMPESNQYGMVVDSTAWWVLYTQTDIATSAATDPIIVFRYNMWDGIYSVKDSVVLSQEYEKGKFINIIDSDPMKAGTTVIPAKTVEEIKEAAAEAARIEAERQAAAEQARIEAERQAAIAEAARKAAEEEAAKKAAEEEAAKKAAEEEAAKKAAEEEAAKKAAEEEAAKKAAEEETAKKASGDTAKQQSIENNDEGNSNNSDAAGGIKTAKAETETIRDKAVETDDESAPYIAIFGALMVALIALALVLKKKLIK